MKRLWPPEKSSRNDSTLASILAIKINFEDNCLEFYGKLQNKKPVPKKTMFVKKVQVMWG
jgi:hypothetical protein